MSRFNSLAFTSIYWCSIRSRTMFSVLYWNPHIFNNSFPFESCTVEMMVNMFISRPLTDFFQSYLTWLRISMLIVWMRLGSCTWGYKRCCTSSGSEKSTCAGTQPACCLMDESQSHRNMDPIATPALCQLIFPLSPAAAGTAAGMTTWLKDSHIFDHTCNCIPNESSDWCVALRASPCSHLWQCT